MNDRSWIVNNCSQTAACAGQILLRGIYNNLLSSLSAWFLCIRSDTSSIQIDSAETNLANEIVLPA